MGATARLGGLACLTGLLLAVGDAQSRVEKPVPLLPPGGTVTGHMVYADTDLPARLARVSLVGVPAANGVSKTPEAQEESNRLGAMTSLDGSFTISNVIPGDYYVVGYAEGYLEAPANGQYQAGRYCGSKEDQNNLYAGAPIVHVTANRTARMDVRIARGAAISGRVMWDDGSPASGVEVHEEPVKLPACKDGSAPDVVSALQFGIPNTDDQGRFRLTGLYPGDYVLAVSMQTRRNFSHQNGDVTSDDFGLSSLTLFAPSAFRLADAKSVTLHEGEELGDQIVTIKLNGLHTVSGQVVSAEDGHGLAVGKVYLRDPREPMLIRSAPLDPDGRFQLTYVPNGAYDVEVSEAQDEERYTWKNVRGYDILDTRVLRTYANEKRQVEVMDDDATMPKIELKPMPKAAKARDRD